METEMTHLMTSAKCNVNNTLPRVFGKDQGGSKARPGLGHMTSVAIHPQDSILPS